MASTAKQAGTPVLSPEKTVEFERRIARILKMVVDLSAWVHGDGDAEEELDVAPADDSQWSPEDQAAIKAAEAQIADGTARIVWEEDLPAADAEIRRMKG